MINDYYIGRVLSGALGNAVAQIFLAYGVIVKARANSANRFTRRAFYIVAVLTSLATGVVAGFLNVQSNEQAFFVGMTIQPLIEKRAVAGILKTVLELRNKL